MIFHWISSQIEPNRDQRLTVVCTECADASFSIGVPLENHPSDDHLKKSLNRVTKPLRGSHSVEKGQGPLPDEFYRCQRGASMLG